MKIFITGGSGFIGSKLTRRLADDNHEVVMLLRNPVRSTVFAGKNFKIIKGDISDKGTLIEGMKDCDLVFHLAANTEPWSEDPSIPYLVNVKGTINVLEAAMESSVKRVIYTSTCGTLGYSENGKIIDETTISESGYCTVYEKTKSEAEKKVLEYCLKGLDAVIVNPSRIYGPGSYSRGNSLTKVINLYIKGLWRIIPGTGRSVGNYVFIDDIIEGHLLAAVKGCSGERYILGGENLSFSELFETIGAASGKRRKMVHLPLSIMKTVGRLLKMISLIFNVPPLITEEWIDKYNRDAIISSEKAVSHLGYRITPFFEGVNKTIDWLKSDHLHD
jgi:farnesol dehydrogenase